MRTRSLAVLVAALLCSASLFAVTPHPGMLGPDSEPLVDSNGNGIPDASDTPITFNFMSPATTINSPYDCKGQSNNFIFGGIDPNGKFITVSRLADNGLTQTMSVGAFDSNHFPTTFNFAESFTMSKKPSPSAVVFPSGVGTLVDTNGDGAYDQLRLTGSGGPEGAVSLNLDLIYLDSTGGNVPDYVTLPWGALETAGFVKGSTCEPDPPQVFVPLTDTNGDGHPDSIVLDLDGNGVSDPVFYASPPLLAFIQPVPTLSQWAALFLSFSLCAAALVALRRRGFSLSI